MQPKTKEQTSDLSLDGLEGLLDSAKAQESNHYGTTGGIDESQQDWTLEETARALGLSRGAIIRRLEDGILSGYKLKRSYGWVWRVRPTWLETAKSAEEPLAAGTGASGQTEARFAPEIGSASCPGNIATNTAEAASQGSDAPGSTVSFEATNFKTPEQVGSLQKERSEQDNRACRDYVEVYDVCEETFGASAFSQASFREMIELRTKLHMTEFQFQDAYKKLEQAQYKIGYLEARLESSQEQLKLIGDSSKTKTWWQRFYQCFKPQS